METRNHKSLQELVISNNAVINVFENKEGKSFFVCGNQTGYVSAKAAEIINAEGFAHPESLQFAECLNNTTGEWIPQIMPAGAKAKATFGLDLIH